MPSPSLSTLLVRHTKAALYALALDVAESVGLDTSSWQAGDPTRSAYHVEVAMQDAIEDVVVGYIGSGFLDYADENWLPVVADQTFSETVPGATYATCTMLLTNGGGGHFEIEPNDITFKNPTTGKTFRNSDGGTLASGVGQTLSLTLVADEAGSASSAAVGDIDETVPATALLGVTCSNTTAAVGTDAQSPAVTKTLCRAKLAFLSPAKGAASYVALKPELTGTSVPTRARAYQGEGTVTVYVAGPSGAVGAGVVAAVQAALDKYAAPFCITVTAVSVANVTVPVTYEMWVYESCNKTAAELEAAAESALATMLAERPIGGDIVPPATTGSLDDDLVRAAIRGADAKVFRVNLTLPASATALTNAQVPVLGTVTATIHLVKDPQ